VVPGGSRCLPFAGVSDLFPRWDHHPYGIRPSCTGQNRKFIAGENTGLRDVSKYDPATGGQNQEAAWKPALVEIEEALVPAFVVEELDDGRCTVFVPSVPTPLAGSIYILSPERVHPLNVPFTQAVKIITRWGSGSKDLVAAMRGEHRSSINGAPLTP
jgi:hypothetical protein